MGEINTIHGLRLGDVSHQFIETEMGQGNRQALNSLSSLVTIYQPNLHTSTLLNTIEWCRGFEDMKDEISRSLTKLLIFLG